MHRVAPTRSCRLKTIATAGLVASSMLLVSPGLVNTAASSAAEPSPPVVTEVSPDTLLASGGTKVIVMGKHFGGAKKVLFGTTKGTRLRVKSGRKLTVVAPPHSPGKVHLRVVTPDGKSAKSSQTQVTYQDPTFPERFIGTSTATHKTTVSYTGTGNECGDRKPYYSEFNETLTTKVVFERFGTPGNYDYDTTGETLEWSVTGSNSGGTVGGPPPCDPDSTTSCTREGAGEVPIGRFRDTRYASGSIKWPGYPSSGSLAPNGSYWFTGAWDFAGIGGPRTNLQYTETCNNGNSYPGNYQPDAWFPTENCDPDDWDNRIHTIAPDGSLSGNDSCSFTDTFPSGDGESTGTRTDTSRWSWSMTPAGPDEG